MITGHGDMDLAIESLKFEATDFVTKPSTTTCWPSRSNAPKSASPCGGNCASIPKTWRAWYSSKPPASWSPRGWPHRAGDRRDLLRFRDMAGEVEGGIRFFNEMPCFVSIHDPSLRYWPSTPSTETDWGTCWAAAAGRSTWETATPLLPAGRQDVDTGQGQRRRETIRYSDGSRWPVMVHTVPIRNSSGELQLVLEFAIDISEVNAPPGTAGDPGSSRFFRPDAELGIPRRERDPHRAGCGVYLAESGLRKSRMDQAQEGLETIKEMVERVRRVVLDVLYFAKERPLECKRVKVADFVEGLLALASPKIRRHSIELVTEMAVDPGEFEVDEGIAAPALLNIFDNAVDACVDDRTKSDHRITLRVRGDADHVTFEIEDDGIGMNTGARENIFSLFYSSKGQAGTGLGLS